jgi:glutathione S-transferase
MFFPDAPFASETAANLYWPLTQANPALTLTMSLTQILTKAPPPHRQVYAHAGSVFKALDERLRAGGRGGHFFFGDRASSLDALLFAHLLYLQSAPVSAPELRNKVRSYRVWGRAGTVLAG